MSEIYHCYLVALNVHGYNSLALGYLQASLKANKSLNGKVKVQTIDLCVDCYDVHQIIQFFSQKPFLVGLSSYVWNFNKMLSLARLINSLWPESKIVLGGPEVTPHPEDVLKKFPFLTAVVYGEGEETFIELVDAFISHRPLKEIRGIAFKDNGEIIVNEPRPLIEPLDKIPSPFEANTIELKDGSTYLETYRGCNFKCAYCFEGKNYSHLRHFSLERIKKDVKLILKSGIKSFTFVDPVFNLNRLHLKKMVKALKEAGVNNASLHTIEIMAENVDSDVVSLLKDVSVESVEVGPQAIHPITVKNINRYFNKERFRKGVSKLKKGGIKVLCDLIIGLPGDNFYRFLASTAFVFSLAPNRVIFSTLHVLPGTLLFEKKEEYGLVFDPEAPHYVWQNSTFSYREIRLAEILAKSLGKEYNLD